MLSHYNSMQLEREQYDAPYCPVSWISFMSHTCNTFVSLFIFTGNIQAPYALENCCFRVCLLINTRINVWSIFAVLFQSFRATDWVQQILSKLTAMILECDNLLHYWTVYFCIDIHVHITN